MDMHQHLRMPLFFMAAQEFHSLIKAELAPLDNTSSNTAFCSTYIIGYEDEYQVTTFFFFLNEPCHNF